MVDLTHRNTRGDVSVYLNRLTLTLTVELHPRDVVPNTLHLPAGDSGLHHGQVGFTAGAGEGRRHVALHTLRVGDSKDLATEKSCEPRQKRHMVTVVIFFLLVSPTYAQPASPHPWRCERQCGGQSTSSQGESFLHNRCQRTESAWCPAGEILGLCLGYKAKS